MPRRYLGEPFDIQGGGIDLRSPHHENEQAQSHGAGWGLARHWVHNAWVTIKGEKMSKSLGNGVEPQEVANRLGAEILRLWTASSDYSGEISVSDEILKRVVEAYRRIRNTLRFLLANVSDFDIQKDAVPLDRMFDIDRYALVMTEQVQKRIVDLYLKYEFHPIVSLLQTFCSESWVPSIWTS